jgi:Flp pilus assembly protein TadB
VPPLLAVFMFMREPEMMAKMMQNSVGRSLMGAALVLEVVGILVFRKIIKIHI